MKRTTQQSILSSNKARWFLLLSASLFLLGMSGAPAQPQAQEPPAAASDIRAESFVTSIEEIYETGRDYYFMSLVDADFEDRITFNTNLTDYYNSHSNLSLYFVVDSVTTDKDKINVRLHWFRKALDSSGSFSKATGSSQLVFKSRGSILSLLYIRGDNPFF